ncbi:MAG: hypothetical protein N3D85_05015 [Candidatus Bathyarchaeota archaeon]|nr:hypothetical protein [Candidatus Bathyarchaeota archaeon]
MSIYVLAFISLLFVALWTDLVIAFCVLTVPLYLRRMNGVSRALLLIALFVVTFALVFCCVVWLRSSVVISVSGFDGETLSGVFEVKRGNCDVELVYFRRWGLGWSLKVDIFEEGKSEVPVFSATAVRYVLSDGTETVELSAHPSLLPGRYYLRVTSVGVQWTVRVVCSI